MAADVDPLECLNSRAVADKVTCGEPESQHCEKCQACPDTCACNTTWRYTFTITPLTDTEAQQVIGKQPANTHVDNAPTGETS